MALSGLGSTRSTLITVPAKILPESRMMRRRLGFGIARTALDTSADCCKRGSALAETSEITIVRHRNKRTHAHTSGGQRSDGSSRILASQHEKLCDGCHRSGVTSKQWL